jgi:adenylylsulfate kinase-like enzyme
MIKYKNMPKLFWFTGQAGAGKTELANALKTQLNREQTIVQQNFVAKDIWGSQIPNNKFVIIDGDDIRELYKNTDYSIEGRKANVDFVQKLCSFLMKNNIVPIVCMVSPFAEQRRNFIQENNGLEIFVYCNEIRGRENYHVDYYEPPFESANTIKIDTTGNSVNQSFEELWKSIL